ncbi:MAG TPA: hypothetical protein VFE47_12625 [Tepidisphaeraceae bacterium]|jgi:transposase|nr:hypothetical protein [Tepidisphaeraceae bacterium]
MLDPANYLVPAQVAKMLGKSRNSVVAEIKSGRMKAMDFRNEGSGRPQYRVLPQWVELWRESRRVIPTVKQEPVKNAPMPPLNGVRARLRRAKEIEQRRKAALAQKRG